MEVCMQSSGHVRILAKTQVPYSCFTKETLFIEAELLKSLPPQQPLHWHFLKYSENNQRIKNWERGWKKNTLQEYVVQVLHAWHCQPCQLKERRRISEHYLRVSSDIIYFKVEMIGRSCIIFLLPIAKSATKYTEKQFQLWGIIFLFSLCSST